MQKVLNEYGRIIIVGLIFVVVIILLFGSPILNIVGLKAESAYVPPNGGVGDERVTYMAEADAPIIDANESIRTTVGTEINLMTLFTHEDNVEYSFKETPSSGALDPYRGVFSPSATGLYYITITARSTETELITRKEIVIYVDAQHFDNISTSYQYFERHRIIGDQTVELNVNSSVLPITSLQEPLMIIVNSSTLIVRVSRSSIEFQVRDSSELEWNTIEGIPQTANIPTDANIADIEVFNLIFSIPAQPAA